MVALEIALLWKASVFPIRWHALGTVPSKLALLWKASSFPIGWDAMASCLCRLHFVEKHHDPEFQYTQVGPCFGRMQSQPSPQLRNTIQERSEGVYTISRTALKNAPWLWANQPAFILGDDEAVRNDLLYLLRIYDIFLGSPCILWLHQTMQNDRRLTKTFTENQWKPYHMNEPLKTMQNDRIFTNFTTVLSENHKFWSYIHIYYILYTII